MKKLLVLSSVFLSLGLAGCSSKSEETLTKEEQEVIYREEVRNQLIDEQKESKKTVENEESEKEYNELVESNESVETVTSFDFESLSKGTQASVIATFYDERATADTLSNGGMFVTYLFDNNYLIIQVTSGAGTGHPMYLLERQEFQYVPIDRVAYMGTSGYETITPAQVTITFEELKNEYQVNSNLYDKANENSYDISGEMTVDSFFEMKALVGSTQTEYTETTAESYSNSSEVLNLNPSQPMFINGELYSGQTGLAAQEDIHTVDQLRAAGYEVYPLTHEEYSELSRQLNAHHTSYDQLLDFYLNNFIY